MSLRTTMLTSAFATAVAVISCGSSSEKKVRGTGDAGAAGEVEAGAAPAGGGGAAGAGTPAPEGGMAGQVEEAGTGGAAGEPPIEPLPLLSLFTVAPGATGLPGSELFEIGAADGNPASMIFGSSSANREAVNGSNRVVITSKQLGLDPNDAIDGFSALQREPDEDDTVYVFSVPTDTEQGLSMRPVRLFRSAMANEAGGDVYASDAVQSLRWNGEGSSPFGYNALVADEQSMGLSPSAQDRSSDGHRDDLTGIQPLVDGIVLTEIYFTVRKGSTGLAGSALSKTAADDRGCTVFRSSLNGTNSVAFTCAELGLTTGAELRGLTAFGSDGVAKVWFTVTADSTGTGDSAVDVAEFRANNVYWSDGSGSNSLQVGGADLGLITSDAIDALNVLSHTRVAYGKASQCTLNPGPLEESSSGPNLDYLYESHGLGKNLLLVTGSSGSVSGVAAYDVHTCALVSHTALLTDPFYSSVWAAVPLPGWLSTDPLKKLEYWLFDYDQTSLSVRRLDETGTIVNTYSLAELVDGASDFLYPELLEYDAVNDRFIGVVQRSTQGNDFQRVIFDRPAPGVADSTLIPAALTPIPHPCALSPSYAGADAAGNSYIVQSNTDGEQRICPLTDSGEFSDLPFTVSIGQAAELGGALVPGQGLYVLSQDSQTAQYVIIQRSPTTP